MFGPILGAVVGGLFGRSRQRSSQRHSSAQTREARKWELDDRSYFEDQYQSRRADAIEDNATGLSQDNQGLDNRITMLRGKHGLTPQEIMGSPAAGGFSSSGATLGQSGAQAHNAKVQSENSAKDRTAMLQAEGIRAETAMSVAAINNATALGQSVIGSNAQKYTADTQASTQRRGQDVQTQVAKIAAEAGNYNSRQIAAATKYAASASASATRYAAATSAAASKYSADRSLEATKIAAASTRQNVLDQLAQKKIVDRAQIDQIAAQTGLILQDKAFKAVQHDERWAKLFSTMSAENVAASALAVINGIDIESVLKGVQADDATKEQLKSFIYNVAAKDSVIFKQFSGAGAMLSDAATSLFNPRGN